MAKFPLAVSAAASVLVTLVTGSIAQTAPPKFPLAISCYSEKSQTWRVGYLTAVNENGVATYLVPGTSMSAKVSADGVLEPELTTNRVSGADCYGKTLDWLRAAGRVTEFQGSQ